VTAYDAAGGALTPASFAAAVRRVCGITLSPSVVAVIFAVFDANGDGLLSPSEFFDLMERRRRAEEARAASRGGDGAGGKGDAGSVAALAACCGECVEKWRAAAA
jgi:hypothetical protein